MHTAALTKEDKTAGLTPKPKLPKNPATIRRCHTALHDFTEMLLRDLDRAVREARARRLAAARGVQQLCRYLIDRQNVAHAEPAPEGVAISADLAMALRQLDAATLTEHLDAWSEAISCLEAFEGEPFRRKPVTTDRRRPRKPTPSNTPDPEGEHLAELDKLVTSIGSLFRDAAERLERRLTAVEKKSKGRTAASSTKLTPPQAAKRLKVSADKVRKWIADGELKASDVAKSGATRPRWLVDEKDLENFLQRRQPMPPAPVKQRKRRRRGRKAKNYFE